MNCLPSAIVPLLIPLSGAMVPYPFPSSRYPVPWPAYLCTFVLLYSSSVSLPSDLALPVPASAIVPLLRSIYLPTQFNVLPSECHCPLTQCQYPFIWCHGP